MRTRTLGLLAVVATVAPVCLGVVSGRGGASPGEGAGSTSPGGISTDAEALAVLRGWDRKRADAWAHGDPARLAGLYVEGSRTGERDVHDLTRWAARGLRVEGLHQQVAAFRVADRRTGRFVVVLTDRTIGGVAVGGAWRTAVPTSAWATHRIALRRSGDHWRVSEVTGRG